MNIVQCLSRLPGGTHALLQWHLGPRVCFGLRNNIKGDLQNLAPAQNFMKSKISSFWFDQVDIHEIDKQFIMIMFYNNRG